MSIVLYDLKGKDGLRYSPFGWRARLALAHKGIEPENVAVGFTEKDRVAFSGQGLVPVIVDRKHGGKVVFDSLQIARYLDEAYPDKPLMDSPQARSLAQFFGNWLGTAVLPAIAGMIVGDVFQRVRPEDQAYFRESREKRFGKKLEEIAAGRDQRLVAFRATLEPLRMLLRQQDFICGVAPAYADYMAFGTLQWPRIGAEFELLEPDDPIHAWRQRMIGLFDNLADRARIGPTD
jgi:glutathione S-transferase